MSIGGVSGGFGPQGMKALDGFRAQRPESTADKEAERASLQLGNPNAQLGRGYSQRDSFEPAKALPMKVGNQGKELEEQRRAMQRQAATERAEQSPLQKQANDIAQNFVKYRQLLPNVQAGRGEGGGLLRRIKEIEKEVAFHQDTVRKNELDQGQQADVAQRSIQLPPTGAVAKGENEKKAGLAQVQEILEAMKQFRDTFKPAAA